MAWFCVEMNDKHQRCNLLETHAGKHEFDPEDEGPVFEMCDPPEWAQKDGLIFDQMPDMVLKDGEEPGPGVVVITAEMLEAYSD